MVYVCACLCCEIYLNDPHDCTWWAEMMLYFAAWLWSQESPFSRAQPYSVYYRFCLLTSVHELKCTFCSDTLTWASCPFSPCNAKRAERSNKHVWMDVNHNRIIKKTNSVPSPLFEGQHLTWTPSGSLCALQTEHTTYQSPYLGSHKDAR